MKYCVHLSIIIVLILGYLSTNQANGAVTQFAGVPYPKGVAVDQQGNVYVQSLSILGDGGLYKFSPDGSLLARNPNLCGEIRLVVDTVNNVLWAIETKGVLYGINPNTLQAQPFLNLMNLPIPQGPVLNILTGQSVDLLMINPQYGDIALRRIDGSRFDLFITGQTYAGGIPFVVRLRFHPTLEADIVVASIPLPNPIIPPPLNTQASGIAVNADGKVLTTFPDDVIGGISPFFLASFNADFTDTNVGRPAFVSSFYDRQVYSLGMTDSTTDKGFYFVGTAQGIGCGIGTAVLHASESLDSVACVADLSSLGLGTMTPDDVAVGSDNSSLYVTMSAHNIVLRVDILPLAEPIITSTTPASSAVDVALNSVITATFSKAMNASTITSSTFTLNNGVTGTVTYNTLTRTATFTPLSNLSANSTYTVTITTGVKDAAGTPLAANKTWNFTTSAIGTITNLLVNGDFESSESSWSKSSSNNSSIIYDDSTLSHGGSGFAMLGGYDDGNDTLYQDITIPADASAVTARFWYRIVTKETNTTTAYDTIQLILKKPSTGVLLQTLTTLSNLNATGSYWAQSPQFDLSSYKGQAIRMQFTASTDNSNVTFFLVDDVTLNTTLPPAHILTVNFLGNGKGTISSNTGFACGTNYTRQISEGTSISLTAAVSAYSDFFGWLGACDTITSNKCNLTMTTDKTVNAAFYLDTAHKARIGASDYFPTLPAAYNSSVGTIIQAWGTDFSEILTCDQDKNVTLDGGYNDSYSAKNGFTLLKGPLTVGRGTLTVDNLIIK